MFAHVFAPVEQVPQFWPLVFGIPLPEFIPMAQEAFFSAGFFLIPTSAPEKRIKLVLFDTFEEGSGLKKVAA